MSPEAISALAGLGGALIGALAAVGGTWWQGHAAGEAAESGPVSGRMWTC